MKTNKLTKLLMVCVIIVLCLISFVGIYTKQGGQMVNLLPEYALGMNVSGARNIKLSVSNDTNEVIYNAEGKVVTDGKNEDGSLKEGHTKKDEPINRKEDLTLNHYQISKKVLEKRLKKLGIGEYIIRQNEKTGEIMLEIPENTVTDEIVSNLAYTGKLELKDSDTDKILMNNQDVKGVSAVYGSDNSGTTVYLSIEFNKEGKKKLEEVSNTYVQTTGEDGNTTTKKVKLELDGETLIETYFGETLSNGLLQLSIGSASTSNEEIASYMKQASTIAALIDSGKMPIQYEITDNTYLEAIVRNNQTTMIVIGIVIGLLLLIGMIYWFIKYRGNGFLASITYIGYGALTLLIIRFTNVIISLESMIAMITLFASGYFVLNYFLNQLNKNLVKQEAIKDMYQHSINILFPLLLIAIVFTFTDWLAIASIGMLLFWGLVILLGYAYICIQLLLDPKEEKKK